MSVKVEAQRRQAIEAIRRERVVWEQSGQRLSDFHLDREFFYKHVKETVFDRLIDAKVPGWVCDEALLAFAKEDWVRSGRSAEDFDRELKTTKTSHAAAEFPAKIVLTVVAVVVGLIYAIFRLAGGELTQLFLDVHSR